jgi:hypothetical protein
MKTTKLVTTKVRKASKRKVATGTTEKELDRLWSFCVRKRDKGICVHCGKPSVHSHHIFSRRHRATRWNTSNGIGLCFGCHFYWVKSSEIKDKQDYLELINCKVGSEQLAILARLSSQVVKIDRELMKQQLTFELETL